MTAMKSEACQIEENKPHLMNALPLVRQVYIDTIRKAITAR